MSANDKKFKLGPKQRKWVRLLKSGRYWQTDRKLAKIVHECSVTGEPEHYSFCCLGLAADQVLGITPTANCRYHKKDMFLSLRDMWAMGLTQDGQGEAARMNDDGLSFYDIGCEFEENPEKYFSVAE